MKKIFSKYNLIFIIIFILISIVFVNPSKVNAVSYKSDFNETSNQYSSNNENYTYSYNYDYIINNYNIDMIVNENNTFDITETITAYFNVPKHGIFRKIP